MDGLVLHRPRRHCKPEGVAPFFRPKCPLAAPTSPRTPGGPYVRGGISTIGL